MQCHVFYWYRSLYVQDTSLRLFCFTPAENSAAVSSWSHKIFLSGQNTCPIPIQKQLCFTLEIGCAWIIHQTPGVAFLCY